MLRSIDTIVPVDGLAPSGAGLSAGPVMAKLRSNIKG